MRNSPSTSLGLSDTARINRLPVCKTDFHASEKAQRNTETSQKALVPGVGAMHASPSWGVSQNKPCNRLLTQL